MTHSVTTDSWAYDVTLAVCIALLWWTAEFCSFASQRRLYFAADFNRAWSVLTCMLVLVAIATVVLEQFLRERYAASVPTAVSTVVAASISYVLVSERLRIFDGGAVAVQRLFRSDKARFGRPGSKGLIKYVIEWRRFERGSALRSGWQEVPTSRRPEEQILVDWSLDHRIGLLDRVGIAEAMRQGGDRLNAMLGLLLLSWLPRQAIETVRIPDRLRERGSLRGGYHGTRGLHVGCKAKDLDFDKWIAERPVNRQVFQLISMEYPDANLGFIDALSDIVKQAGNAEQLASLFICRWDEEIDKAQQKRKRALENGRTSDTELQQVDTPK